MRTFLRNRLRRPKGVESQVDEKRTKQAGAELCQAQVKLGWPASSFSLRFKLVMSLKIGTYTWIKDYSKKIMVSQV